MCKPSHNYAPRLPMATYNKSTCKYCCICACSTYGANFLHHVPLALWRCFRPFAAQSYQQSFTIIAPAPATLSGNPDQTGAAKQSLLAAAAAGAYHGGNRKREHYSSWKATAATRSEKQKAPRSERNSELVTNRTALHLPLLLLLGSTEPGEEKNKTSANKHINK